MTMALISKNKLQFVNGSISVPNLKDRRHASWERCNTMVLSWLHRSITDSISQSILWMDQDVDVCRDLKERFSQSDIFRISDLHDEIFCLHQGENSISDLYTQLKILWDELESLQPTPTCKCVKPCCSISSQVRSIRDRDYSIRFLKGLNEQFSHVRSQIMLMDPLPPINRVFSLMTQQERQMHLNNVMPNVTDGNSKVFFNSTEPQSGRGCFYTRGRGRGYNGGRGRAFTPRLCTCCGKTSHTVDTCFEKHGYPPGYRVKGVHKANIASTDNPEEVHLYADHNQVVHLYADHNQVVHPYADDNQMAFKQSMKHQPMQQQQMTPSHVSNLVQTKALNVGTQVKTVNTENSDSFSGNNNMVHWILDTGATDHITHSFGILIQPKKIEPIAISLPNGSQVYSYYSGTVVLSQTLTLSNVLFVEKFSVKLISVTKLAQDTNCCVIFQPLICIIQQHPSMEIIGSAKLDGGLNVDNPCDICHYAKQRKLPFTSSVIVSDKAFDLVHVDIWGPYSVPSIHGHKYMLTIVDDHTRFTWGIMMKLNSETKTHIHNFVTLIENQFGVTIKTFRSDNGSEFLMS
ncbi:uncharacterized protein LOC133300840 [Gastrolobium bilobum]|uniref:uncharacterized protein LOC133300840 n=1 Tax=Gastrolobium bilobum TaxID=150636 RepID=UPI002AB171CD|nr:uncharacterized protein LOC133300840 [Gastrolobium bilobum]